MATDNETVEEALQRLRDKANGNNVDCHGLVVEISQDEIWGICDRIEAAWKRERSRIEADALNAGAFVEASRKPRRNCDSAVIAELQRRLKVTEDALELTKNAMCNYCRSTPDAKGIPCLNGCETLAVAKNALAMMRERKI